MASKQNQSDTKLDRLVEIYKLQTRLTSDISNRRITTNRFYQVLLSGLILIFFTFLQHRGKFFSEEAMNKLVIEKTMIVVGILGAYLSWIWCLSVNAYLELNSRKYKALKKLETELEYQFFTHEWELLGEKRKYLNYRQLSKFEVYLPYLFLIFFFALYLNGLFKMPNKFYLLCLLLLLPQIISVFIMILRPFLQKKDTSHE